MGAEEGTCPGLGHQRDLRGEGRRDRAWPDRPFWAKPPEEVQGARPGCRVEAKVGTGVSEGHGFQLTLLGGA